MKIKLNATRVTYRYIDNNDTVQRRTLTTCEPKFMAAKARKAIIAKGIMNPEILSIEHNVKISYDIPDDVLDKYRVEEKDTSKEQPPIDNPATSEPVNAAE